MALFQMILFILLALNLSLMFSGLFLAQRMGYYLMRQVMMLMLGMLLGIGILVVELFFPPVPAMFDLLHVLILVDFVLILLAALLQFVTVVPMFAPMTIGIAFATVNPPEPTMPTTTEVVVEEL